MGISLERNNQLLKKLDFWVGIPLLYCLSLFKRKVENKPKEINTIGIFAFAAIGDSILSSCLLPALKNQYPQAKITVFSSSANAAIYSILSGYDELVILPVTKPLKTLRLFRKCSLDVLIDTSQWPKLSALYSLFIKARFKIGFETSGQHRHFGYDVVVRHSNAVHELQNFENLLKPLDITQRGMITLDFPKIMSQDAHDIAIDMLKPYIIFHPWASGTRSELREWPISAWAELGKKILEENLHIIITGSVQDQVGANELAQIIGGGGKVEVMAGALSFAGVAKVILGANAVVSVNTGIAHLADQLKVPTVVLNGPTNSARWGLVNPNSINIDVAKINGGGFLSLGFEYPNDSQYLMDQISVQAVGSALKQIAASARAI